MNNEELEAMLGITSAGTGSKNTESLGLKGGENITLKFDTVHWGNAGAYRQDEWSIPSGDRWNIPAIETLMVIEDQESGDNIMITQAVMNTIATDLLTAGADFTKSETEINNPKDAKATIFGKFTLNKVATITIGRQDGPRGKYIIEEADYQV